MLKKESLNRIFNKILEAQIVSLVEEKGFKFKKSKAQFSKVVDDYTIYVSCLMPFSPLTLLGDNETLVFEIGFSMQVVHEKFKKWFNEKFEPFYNSAQPWSNHASVAFKKNGLFPCCAYVDISEIQSSDFYEPSKSQLFKHNVSLAISGRGGNKDEVIPLVEDFMAQNFDLILQEATANCDDAILSNWLKMFHFGFDYSNYLVFVGDMDGGKLAYAEHHRKLKEKIENKDFTERASESDCQIALKNFVKFGKEILDLDLSSVQKPKNIAVNLGAKFCIDSQLKFNEAFSIVDSPNGIFDYHTNMKGETIIAHSNDDLITIWNKDGVLIAELRIEQNIAKIVGYNEYRNVFFVNNYLITRNFELKQLKPPIVIINRKEVVVSNYQCSSPVFIKEDRQWVVLYSFHPKNQKRQNMAHFYDENFELVKTLPLEDDILEVIPKRKWVLTYKRNSYFNIFDFDGNKIVNLESNNAAGGSYDMDYHCFTKSFSHLFSFSYYVKSQLFNLSDFSMKALWAHTTYEKDYKELYYNDINHNFGVTKASFSPDETYLVAGADHGKYVAWKLPSIERIELIPNAEYLKKMPHAVVVSIGKNTYLKNRGPSMRNIQFWENGKYFSFQLNEDTLIFNNQFEHIQTIENSGRLKCYGQFATSFKNNILTLYQ